jgi:RHS repeat-associated protein
MPATSGRTIKTCYDPASRITQVTGTKNSVQTTYASFPATPNAAYWPHGAIKSLTRGDSLTESWTYNNDRMQPMGISVGTTGVPRSAFGMDLYYCANKGLSCADNSGNVKTTSLSVLGTDQNYTYDHLSRITSAEERVGAQAPIWTETYGHDSYANHWVSAGAVESFTPTASTNFNTSNQLLIQGSGYDAAGNQIAIGGYSYIWDAESRLVKSMITQIPVVSSYDGDGRRVQKVKCPAGTNPCTSASTGAQPTVYVYDAAGQLAAEYTVGWTPAASPCTTCYLTMDHLGSGRVLTDTTGVRERHDYAPFGRELFTGTRTSALGYASSAVGEVLKVGFTGKERDTELSSAAMQGLDYFGARYLSEAQARFTSPDAPFADQHPDDPQSWNMYTYVRNNPLRNTDPNGTDCQNGVRACADYIIGGLNAIANIPSNLATSINHGINALTGSSIPDAPRLPSIGAEQQQGEESANAVMLVSPLMELGTAKILTTTETITGTAEQAFKSGSFSINDWTGYPAGVPKPPEGTTFRLLEGAEYQTARTAANQTNQAIRQADPAAYAGQEIHEISPVKFGGSPTKPSNKVALPTNVHRQQVTPWWNQRS